MRARTDPGAWARQVISSFLADRIERVESGEYRLPPDLPPDVAAAALHEIGHLVGELSPRREAARLVKCRKTPGCSLPKGHHGDCLRDSGAEYVRARNERWNTVRRTRHRAARG